VELAGAAAIIRQIDRRFHKLKLPRHILEILPVESTRQKEPFCRFEVACAQKKTELVSWGAEAAGEAA